VTKSGCPFGSLIGDRPQRSEQGCARDEREGKPQARVGKTLTVSLLRVLRLEEADLSKQRARDRELDRDHRLEELNGDFHESAQILTG
jgi:hypothetical protein